MSRLALTVAFALGLSTSVFAQEPNMAETAAWLKSDGVALLGAFKVRPRSVSVLRSLKYTYADLVLSDCHLTWTETFQIEDEAPSRSKTDVPMADLDLSALRVVSEDDYYPARVVLAARSNVGKTFRTQREGKPESTDNVSSLTASDASGAERVLNAVKRAAVLCGAKAAAF